jgi:hypothetical protein
VHPALALATAWNPLSLRLRRFSTASSAHTKPAGDIHRGGPVPAAETDLWVRVSSASKHADIAMSYGYRNPMIYDGGRFPDLDAPRHENYFGDAVRSESARLLAQTA